MRFVDNEYIRYVHKICTFVSHKCVAASPKAFSYAVYVVKASHILDGAATSCV